MHEHPPTLAARDDRARMWLYAAAVLSAVAGLLHLLVMPEHLAEWFGYGLFFLVVALAQLAYTVLLLRWPPSPTLFLAGIVGNTLIIAFYVITRTIGIPLGPAAGEVEEIGFVDACSKLVELALVGCLFFIYWHRVQKLTE